MIPYPVKLLGRLQGGLRHLREGTLPERLRSERQRRLQRRRSARWDALCGTRQYLDASIQPGIRMRLPLDSMLGRLIYCDDFEADERQFFNTFLRPGDVFVDAGANIGLFSLIAAHRVGPGGHVHAFEPCAQTFERLQANVALNGFANVSCHPLALSSENASLEMRVSEEGFDAWNSLAQPTAGSRVDTETVACVTWDDFAQKHDLVGRVTFMKIDVEGWETHLLSGARATLSREDAPTLQVEFTEEATRSAGSSCERLYQALEEMGYRMFVYDARSNRLVPDPLRESYPYLNLVAAKRPEMVAARLNGHKEQGAR